MNGNTAMHWTAFGVNVATVNAVLLLLLHAGGWRVGRSMEEIASRLLFSAWALSPYVPLLLVSAAFLWCKVRDFGPGVVNLLGTLLVCGFGLFIYVDVFFIHLDAQSGIAFVTVPMLQWLGVVATLGLELGIYLFVAKRRRRHHR